MAATKTVTQVTRTCISGDSNSTQNGVTPQSALRSRRGVVVLNGYGTSVRVERGHLVVEDGIGSDRYQGRFSRIGHGIERLVVVGADGLVSLSALRWLADQNASFVMLERDGTVLATTGPVRSSDVRLRRAQALAHQTDLAFRISRELMDRKLAGQERVARKSLQDDQAATLIRQKRSELAEVESIDAIRFIESHAAKLYWKAWRAVPVMFPDKERPRVPVHWQNFGSRVSPLSGSPRLAANPVNAILNYLYALLEAECRLAIAVVGLDPGMGVLHMDTTHRDSLACDLMEPVRPNVDEYVFNWILRHPLKRDWFFEERNGNCRLMAELASQLAETTSTWARLVAPLAEWTVKEIAVSTNPRRPIPATRLTQNHKRALTGRTFNTSPTKPVRPPNVCNACGKRVRYDNEQCTSCATKVSTQRLIRIAATGRVASQTDEAKAKRAKTHLASLKLRQQWSSSDQPSWLTAKFYAEKIRPQLVGSSTGAIARDLLVSRGYATEIRRGKVPHPRHWQALAKLTGMSK
jgi:CRISPR-associated endonuclease Cas1